VDSANYSLKDSKAIAFKSFNDDQDY
jgi:hypothetical protein